MTTNIQPKTGRAIFSSEYNGRTILQWIDVEELDFFDATFLTNATRVKGSTIASQNIRTPIELLRGDDGKCYSLFVEDYSVREAKTEEIERFNAKLAPRKTLI